MKFYGKNPSKLSSIIIDSQQISDTDTQNIHTHTFGVMM